MARILVVEDDADLMQLLSRALNKEGFDVHYAFNGREGLEKIRALRPDLVFLDLRLPILSGIDVLEAVAKDSALSAIPVVVMTAYADRQQLLERSVRLQGAREFLQKPIRPREAAALARRLVSARTPPGPAEPARARKGSVSLDLRFRTVFVGESRVAVIPPKRAALLKTLLEAPGVVPRERLLAAAWDGDANANLLEKTIQRLREDLGPVEGKRIQTRPDGYELLG